MEQKNNGPGWKWFVLIGAVALIAWMVAMPPGGGAVDRSQPGVTLHAAPGQTVVQMFPSLAVGADVSATFPAGTRCTRLSGPHTYTEAGIRIDYHRLDCNGQTGYVNTRWVR